MARGDNRAAGGLQTARSADTWMSMTTEIQSLVASVHRSTPAAAAPVSDAPGMRMADELTGMSKKWQRHFRHSQWQLAGKLGVAAGGMLFLSMCVAWTQILYPLVLNSKVAFEVVLSAEDQASGAPAYAAFTRDLYAAEAAAAAAAPAAALTALYLWNVTNARDVVASGYMPRLAQAGPYAFVRRTRRYDIVFAPKTSRTVSYKEWSYLEPVTDARACRDMVFRMDLAALAPNATDCPGAACDCRDPAGDVVTVVNTPFLRLVHEETPQCLIKGVSLNDVSPNGGVAAPLLQGLLADLAQEVFEGIHTALTGGFVLATKAALLPGMLESVWKYRRAADAARTVGALYAHIAGDIGADAARKAFIAPGTQDAAIDCGGYSVPPASDAAAAPPCPWGAGAYVAAAAAAAALPGAAALALTAAEAEHLLGARAPPLLSAAADGALSDAASVPLWLATGRLLGADALAAVAPWPMRGAREPGDGAQRAALVALLCSWEPAETGAAAPEERSAGWGECGAKVDGVAAWLFATWYRESGSAERVTTEWLSAADAATLACDGASDACGWPIGAAAGLSLEAARSIMDPGLATVSDAPSLLSVHSPKGFILWADAYRYCSAPDRSCAEFSPSAIEAATVTLPANFPAADAAADPSGAARAAAICSTAQYLFRNWAGTSPWAAGAAARYLSAVLPQGTFSVTDDLTALGYAQWGGGHVTRALYGLPSVTAVARAGAWALVPRRFYGALPEFGARAAAAGYPSMALPVATARALLTGLARADDAGRALRAHVITRATTYYGTGDGDGFAAGDAMHVEENTAADYATDDPQHSGDGFAAGDAMRVDKNIAADYAPDDPQVIAALGGDAAAAARHLAALCATTLSSAAECAALDTYHQHCVASALLPDSVAVNCDAFQTRVANPARDPLRGAQCTAARLEVHYHPWPKQAGGVLADALSSYVWRQVLMDGGYVCAAGVAAADDCDHARGGLFTTAPALNVLFRGRADPLVMKLLSTRYRARGVSYACATPAAIARDADTCAMIESGAPCGGDGGFTVRADGGGASPVEVVSVSPAQPALWHAAEVQLPRGGGGVRSPVFALRPGGTWGDEAFQKAQACGDWRMLGGPAGLWNRRDNNFNIVNTSTCHNFNDLWEGFARYALPYGARRSGTRADGSGTVPVLSGDALTVFAMAREDAQALSSAEKRAAALRVPTPTTNAQLTARPEVYAPVNRYYAGPSTNNLLTFRTSRKLIIEKACSSDAIVCSDWAAAGARVGLSLRDSLGMPYAVPPGMSATAALSGMPSFASDAHFYSNAAAGGVDWSRLQNLSPAQSRHASTVDVDPVTGIAMRHALRTQLSDASTVDVDAVTGIAMRRALRSQVSLRVERSALLPALTTNQDRCPAPTKTAFAGGYGCFLYIPLAWTDDQRVIDDASARRLADEFWLYPTRYAPRTAAAAALAAAALCGGGALLWAVCRWRRRRFEAIVYVD
ncbi:hypothetical protein JKP88DRAFT_261336 [Tribonema minus]|uniref:Uncharacterized protein n=1 Tax=Tribonema minus TaxID=303371 RepID=A0A835YN97_9STRA|nr:hypothetical protein JKP88DRAFT_261336 [Tribonema minus]